MTKKRMTLEAPSVNEGITKGLAKLGLPQSKAIIKIKQHEQRSILGTKPAIISILYDETDANQAVQKREEEAFNRGVKIVFEESAMKICVPPAFYNDNIFHNNDYRTEFLGKFFGGLGVGKLDEENLHQIASDSQSQYHFVAVKTFDTTPLNEEGGALYVELREEDMECHAILFYAGEITEEKILDVLKEKGYIKGVLQGAIREVLEQQRQGFFLIAKGKAPTADRVEIAKKYFEQEGELESMFERLQVDTRSVKKVSIVARNELLLTLGAPVLGEEGYTVLGKKLEKQEGSLDGVELGANVYLAGNECDVYANVAGRVIWDEEKQHIDVDPVYIVEGNVDFNEGNIQGFVGNVVIKGDVRPKFSVVAEGDIEIFGSVEDAIVESTGGDVIIHGTVVHLNEGYIKAKQAIYGTIIKNAKLSAHKIHIDKECMNSELEGDSIFIQGAPGVLVGGDTKASSLLRVNVLGSEMSVATKVEVGNVKPLITQLQKTKSRCYKQKQEHKEVEEVINMLTQENPEGPSDPELKEQLEKAQSDLPVLEEDIEHLEGKIKSLTESIALQESARLEVLKVLYPQVDIHIYDGYLLPLEKEQNVGLHCKEGMIVTYML